MHIVRLQDCILAALAETDLAYCQSCQRDEEPVVPGLSAVESPRAQAWKIEVALCWAMARNPAALCELAAAQDGGLQA